MSYRDPQQVIDNSIGIVAKGITNFLSKTTKDIQAFAANKKAKDEAYRKTVNKKTYGAQEQLRKEFLESKQQLNEMRRRGDGTEDLKDMTGQAMDLLKKRYRDAGKKIDELMNENADTSVIQETIDDAIMWQGDFYNGMANFNTSQVEYLKMLENDGEIGGAIGSTEYQNNLTIYTDKKIIKLDRVFSPPVDIDMNIVVKEKNYSKVYIVKNENTFANYFREVTRLISMKKYDYYFEKMIKINKFIDLLKN